MSAARLFRPVDSHVWKSRPGRSLLCLATPLALWLLGAGVALAQGRPAAKPKIPPAEELEWETADGVSLKATYLPGTRGKDTVPVILLHGYEGNRNDYARLAKELQAEGCAVLVPDLRGHGDSVEVKNSPRKLKASSMPTTQFARMVTVDMENARKFLKEKNDAGELNIDKLCIVGSGMGAVVAMEWTYRDWMRPRVQRLAPYIPRQGCFVKALVLISPEWSMRGLSAASLFRDQTIYDNLSVLIVVGDRSKSAADARRIYTMFQRTRPAPSDPKDKDLFKIDRRTSLQGTKLLNEPAFRINRLIEQFIKLRVANQSYPWQSRKIPGQ